MICPTQLFRYYYLNYEILKENPNPRILIFSQPLIVCSSGHRAISSSSRLASKDFASMSKGTTGVEERLAVLWENAVRTGRIDPMRFVAVTSSNAAKIFNLYPKKVGGFSIYRLPHYTLQTLIKPKIPYIWRFSET